MKRGRFWLSSLVAALVFAALAQLIFPYARLGIDGGPEREQAWLLILWTAGVLAICFGATGLISVISPIGFRDVAEAGSVPAALQARRELRERHGESWFYNFAGWTVTAGGWTILVYFVAWWLLAT